MSESSRNAQVIAEEHGEAIFEKMKAGGVHLMDLTQLLHKEIFACALKSVKGNKAEVARMFGMKRTTLCHRLSIAGLDPRCRQFREPLKDPRDPNEI